MRGLIARRRDRISDPDRSPKAGRSVGKGRGNGAKAPKRSRGRSRLRFLSRRLMAVMVVGLVLIGGTVYAIWSGLADSWQRRATAVIADLAAGAGLTLHEVLVEGRYRTDPDELLAAVGHQRGDPIFAINPEAIRERIEAIGWVSRASVERRLPGLLYIRLVERRPLALWQHSGEVHVVDNTGRTLRRAAATDFPHLPLIVGPDAPQYFGHLLALVESDLSLWRRVTAAVRVGERRWNLRLDNDVDVLLPETDTATAWRRLSLLQADYRIIERDLTAIDLRLPDRLIVDIHPDAVFGSDHHSGLEHSEDA